MTSYYRLSFAPGDLVTPGDELIIDLGSEVNLKEAASAIKLLKYSENVASCDVLDAKVGTVKVSTKGLPPGNYQLLVANPGDTEPNNQDLIPVRLGILAGKIPPEFTVQHSSRVIVEDTKLVPLNPGADSKTPFVEFVKTFNKETGKHVELAFDQTGIQIDGKKLLGDVKRRHFEKFGNVDETLFDKLSGLADLDALDVAIVPKITVDITAYEKPNKEEIKAPLPEAVKLIEQALEAKDKLRSGLNLAGIVAKGSSADSNTAGNGLAIFAKLTRAQINELAKNDDVGAIYLHEIEGELDLVKSIELARANTPHSQGHTGQGVRVAVFETGPSDTSKLSFEERYLSNPASSSHARMTSGIIKNTESNKPHGFAPGCLLYSANSSDNAALDWAVEQKGCTVISQSFHRASEQTSDTLSFDDFHKDWLAIKWPYPTIVQAAGNGEDSEYVNHKGFNTISVANHDDTRAAMSPSSVFRNPSSTHGDRELPEISANGTDVTVLGLTSSGTSFAAPAVAGCAAIIQGIEPILKSWQEGTRAILLASTFFNVTGGTWGADLAAGIDQLDGTGAVDARFAASVAAQRHGRGNTAAISGWDVGSITDADVGSDGYVTFVYNARGATGTPIGPPLSRVKIALAWNSVATNANSELTRDFDLYIQDATTNSIVASSASWNNSYEIAQFLGNWGRNYIIKIRRASGVGVAWYGIAWHSTPVVG
jgi:hypothetical protein